MRNGDEGFHQVERFLVRLTLLILLLLGVIRLLTPEAKVVYEIMLGGAPAHVTAAPE